MADDIDFNDVIEDIFLSENTLCQDSYKEGFRAGSEEGNPEGYHLGYHRGAEIGRELGYYLGTIINYLEQNKSDAKQEDKLSDKTVKQLEKVKGLIDTFPRNNSEHHDILSLLEAIRAQYKKVCAMLKISANNPFTAMETSITKVHQHLDRILKFLNPLLPLANCHMVEFFTENHWDKLLPNNLIQIIDKWDLNHAVGKFWTYASETKNNDNCELRKWIHNAQSHSLKVNNDYCISVEELEQRLECWGGCVPPEIKITEFMTSKKSYEVQRMSRLVASLYNATSSTHCMEAGGGRGHLLVALTLGYNIPSLTVDCDDKALKNAADRVKIIQKQWRAIAKKITNGNEEFLSDNRHCNLHRFATAFITNKTNVANVVKDSFPEHCGNDYKVLLTGLHTCGNLGPDSLRIFSSQSSTTGLFNVPCCYHLLTEKVDASLFDVFQRDYGCGTSEHGFPMSEYLRGVNLGRNARMLAAQSLERVLHHRQLPNKSLLYRALFQIIVKTHLPKSNLKDGKLKKVASKCDNFTQYFKMADNVLSLGLFDRLPDSYLTDVSKDLHCQWKQIVMFNLLRLCLAQVIESVVLLDRLLYLFENGYKKSFIVKLFDPVMSPRCHSIVSVR